MFGAMLVCKRAFLPLVSAACTAAQQRRLACRYVALNTLLNVAGVDVAAVQRHRGMIVECVKDPDTSIRRRALDLVYCLVSTSNVEVRLYQLSVCARCCAAVAVAVASCASSAACMV